MLAEYMKKDRQKRETDRQRQTDKIKHDDASVQCYDVADGEKQN